MPARQLILNPDDGPLQKFAYDLRELGAGKCSISWIAKNYGTNVSRAALYAAVSGTRLPTEETLAALLRWWAGDPADESDERSLYGNQHCWSWVRRLPAEHEGRRLVKDWQARHRRLQTKVWQEREFRAKAAPVTIDLPAEQKIFIAELRRLIKKTGLEDEAWLVLGYTFPAVQRYLSGQSIPTFGSCLVLAAHLVRFLPEGPDEEVVADRLLHAASYARAGRARERRLARLARRSDQR
ncbi:MULTISPECIES: hypothetical protein [Streptomyces]|uniref:hypothetical protein n=1 Tax=Streptomyces TaxID=1883 RepID=UPI0007573EBB|nr:hypothetical protein [Streptomyces sp. IMTB 1903]